MNRIYASGALSVCIVFLAACGTTQLPKSPPPNDVSGELHHIVYDQLLINVEMPYDSNQALDVAGKGAAAKEGFMMMASAPLGCLQAGMFAGACLAMAPFFPVIAAARVEEPEKALYATQTFFKRVEEYGLQQKLANSLMQRLLAEQLPLAPDNVADISELAVTINVFIGVPGLDHSGYKNGSIELSLPYTIELTNRNGAVMSRKSGKVHDDFDNESRSVLIYPRLDEWVEEIVDESVSGLLLEWQPVKTLGYIYPGKEEKKKLIVLRYSHWSAVDSLSPRLLWQSLYDVMPANRLANIIDVSYEVEIWAWKIVGPTRDWVKHKIVSARNLTEPVFSFTTELLPCQIYHWRPRARFRYRGTLRTTSAPTSYQLVTPGPGCKQPAWVLPYSPALHQFDPQAHHEKL